MVSSTGGRGNMPTDNLGVGMNADDEVRIQVNEIQGVFGF